MLKAKDDENVNLRTQFKEYEISVNHKWETEVKGGFSQYESSIDNLKKENEDLRRRLQDAGDLGRRISEYENKLAVTSQEMDRLNQIIRTKTEENQKLTSESDELRRRLRELTEINRKLPEYEQKMIQLQQDNERLQHALKAETDELNALGERYRLSQQENEKLVREFKVQGQTWSFYEQKINNINRERDDINRKKSELESKIALLVQELERVNGQLNQKNQENQHLTAELDRMKRTTEGEYMTLQKNYTVVTGEFDKAKLHLQDYEASIKKLYGEFERLQGIINELNREKQALHEMVQLVLVRITTSVRKSIALLPKTRTWRSRSKR